MWNSATWIAVRPKSARWSTPTMTRRDRPSPLALGAGEWHKVEIEVRGTLVKVAINGKPVNDVDMTKIDRTLLAKVEKWAEADLDRKKGHIGIQS